MKCPGLPWFFYTLYLYNIIYLSSARKMKKKLYKYKVVNNYGNPGQQTHFTPVELSVQGSFLIFGGKQ